MTFRPTLVILVYHNLFRRMPAGTWYSAPSDYMTTYEAFERQIDLLARDPRIEFTTPSRFFGSTGEPRSRIGVYCTFDDGYRSILPALEMLKSRAIPAGVFVNSRFVGTPELAWPEKLLCFFRFMEGKGFSIRCGARTWTIGSVMPFDSRMTAFLEIRTLLKKTPTDERETLLHELYAATGFDLGHWTADALYRGVRLLTWDAVKRIDADGFAVGGHTSTHPILARSTPSRIRSEIEDDKRLIETMLGKRIDEFAIPNGQPEDYDAFVLETCERAGYRFVHSTSTGPNSPDGSCRPTLRYDVGNAEADLEALIESVAAERRLA